MISADPIRKARDAWGEDVPDWVLRLAEACAETSQSRVARRLGVSGSLVSHVLAANYRGDMRRIEDLCRGEFERATISCPVLGELAPAACEAWRRKAGRLRPANNLNARMFRACRACPRMTGEEP